MRFNEALQENENYKFLLDLVENLDTLFNEHISDYETLIKRVDDLPDELDELYASKSHTHIDHLTESDILDLIYPVGSIYLSVNETDPSENLGGTWGTLRNFIANNDIVNAWFRIA